jgi:hypothetical protein
MKKYAGIPMWSAGRGRQRRMANSPKDCVYMISILCFYNYKLSYRFVSIISPSEGQNVRALVRAEAAEVCKLGWRNNRPSQSTNPKTTAAKQTEPQRER